MELMEQLEVLRVRRGISKRALCVAAGVGRKSLYYSDDGMKLGTLLRLLKVLDGRLKIDAK